MKLKKIFLLFIIFVITSMLYTVCADDVDEEDENVENYVQENVIDVVSKNISSIPTLNSRKCVIYDRTSKTVIYGKNETVKTAMASTTKIMTAIIVLENSNLKDTVTVSAKAGGTGGSRLGLKKGDKTTVNDLLYGLMLRSGNDAAVALAEHVGGSIQGFAELMNKKAEELNLNNTHFVTPHGLDDSNHYTTALELAKLADYAMQNQKFANIVGTKITTISINGQQRQIGNTNELLGVLNGVVGIKTGFTNNAGRCLVTETKRDNMDIITVVLGADTKKDRTKDSVKLIEYAFASYEIVNIEEKINTEFENWKNINTQRIEIDKAKENQKMNLKLETINIKNLPLKDGELENIKCEINCLTQFEAPVQNNIKIGTLIVKKGDEIIETLDITNTEIIERKNWQDYLKQILKEHQNLINPIFNAAIK